MGAILGAALFGLVSMAAVLTVKGILQLFAKKDRGKRGKSGLARSLADSDSSDRYR